MRVLAFILVTWLYLIGESIVVSTPCDDIDYIPADSASLPSCVTNKVCNITGSNGWIPDCQITHGTECRHREGKGQTTSPNYVTADTHRSDSAILTRLEIRHLDMGQFIIFTFYAEIGVPVQDIANNRTLGVKLEFISTGQERNNCMQKPIPVCRYFHLSQHGVRTRTSHSSHLSDLKESLHLTKRQEMVYISHSCFGLDVFPGSFLIGLTSYPGSQRPLKYLVDFHYSERRGHWNWIYQVVGVAKVPGTNEIRVVIQGPAHQPDDVYSTTNNNQNYIVHLELIRKSPERSREQIQIIQLKSNESNAVFKSVPSGLYFIRATLKGHRCEFNASCPSFVSQDVFVDSTTENKAWPVTGDSSASKHPVFSAREIITVIASIVTLCVVCVIALCWFRYRERRRRGGRSGINKIQSILVLGLETGRLKELAVTYFAQALEDIINAEQTPIPSKPIFNKYSHNENLHTHRIFVTNENYTELFTKKEKDPQKQCLTKAESKESATHTQFQQSPLDKTAVDVNKSGLKSLKMKLKQHRAIVIVQFLPDTNPGSTESGSTCLNHNVMNVTRNEPDDVIDVLMTIMKRHNWRENHDCFQTDTNICVVNFIESTNCKRTEDALSFLENSSSSDSTVDSCSTMTCLIHNADHSERDNLDHNIKNKSKTPSTSNVWRLNIEDSDNKKSLLQRPSTTAPTQTFYLPSDVINFFQWLDHLLHYKVDKNKNNNNNNNSNNNKKRRNDTIHVDNDICSNFTPNVSSLQQAINTCDKWQAALTCARKAFVDKDVKSENPESMLYHGEVVDECVTIITEKSESWETKCT